MTLPLDASERDNGLSTLIALPDPAETYYDEALRQTLDLVLDSLPDARMKVIIQLRYGLLDELPKTHKETGEFLGISPSRVPQLHHRTLRHLREPGRTRKERE